jgi:hypothetical protein
VGSDSFVQAEGLKEVLPSCSSQRNIENSYKLANLRPGTTPSRSRKMTLAIECDPVMQGSHKLNREKLRSRLGQVIIMQCARCLKEKRSSALLSVKLNSQSQVVCGDCFSKLREEYRIKKTCENCAHWSDEYCTKIDAKLEPDTVVGYKEFFTQAEDCDDYADLEESDRKELAGESGNNELELQPKHLQRFVISVSEAMLQELEKERKPRRLETVQEVAQQIISDYLKARHGEKTH